MQPGFDEVMRVVRERLTAAPDAPRIVAVDGPSGSGKSTLARPLAERLGAPVIKVDDFVTWQHFGAWWPRFERQVVEPLLAGRDARYQVRDWAGDEFGDGLGEWRTVSWAPVVVVEGVTSTRRAIAGRLACRLWVEAPADLRLERGLRRDGESHRGLWERWMQEEAAFFAEDGARERADLVVDTAV